MPPRASCRPVRHAAPEHAEPGGRPPYGAWASGQSSYSGSQGECVEVARNVPQVTAIRDSKDPAGPRLIVGAGAWASFVEALKTVDSAAL
ncbi:DUF397 domain-containing protein [Streptomyces platensis]|uniref:DUF397 domain-containing protein n=1 Tax=Streptomyces platensis TaxID=58346 RepID=UPI002E818654|nr:DUF397 domain-containing protein [Streptomyces platensis]